MYFITTIVKSESVSVKMATILTPSHLIRQINNLLFQFFSHEATNRILIRTCNGLEVIFIGVVGRVSLSVPVPGARPTVPA